MRTIRDICFFACTMVLCFLLLSRFTEGLWIPAAGAVAGGAILFYFFRNMISAWSLSTAVLVCAFLLIITAPLAGRMETQSLEKRKLAPFPEWRWENVWAFFFGFQDYFNDRFAFRNTSVHAISRIKYHFFGVSPVPQLVSVGKSGWLFYSPQNVVDDATLPYHAKELQTIRMNLRIITKWFDEHGMKFYFTVAPFKQRIYPDLMPDRLRVIMTHSKREQLLSLLRNDPGIRLIEYDEELKEGRKVRPTYYRTDTHWNEYGAFLAYEKIMQRLQQDFPQLKPFRISDFKIDSGTLDQGDLELMLGFKGEITSPIYFLRNQAIPAPDDIDISRTGTAAPLLLKEMPNSTTPLKLFMARDSYTEYLRIFLTPHFRKSLYAMEPKLPLLTIAEFAPDIVIHEMLEQFVMKTIALPPEIANDTVFLRKHFPGYLSFEPAPAIERESDRNRE